MTVHLPGRGRPQKCRPAATGRRTLFRKHQFVPNNQTRLLPHRSSENEAMRRHQPLFWKAGKAQAILSVEDGVLIDSLTSETICGVMVENRS